jgi:hypothetical protein
MLVILMELNIRIHIIMNCFQLLVSYKLISVTSILDIQELIGNTKPGDVHNRLKSLPS